jgi:hypothetical protein
MRTLFDSHHSSVPEQSVHQAEGCGTLPNRFSLVAFGGKVLAGVNGKVLLFAKGDGEGLKKICGHYGHIAVLYMKTFGDYILVGDLMR